MQCDETGGGWPSIDTNIFLKPSVMLYRPLPPCMMPPYDLLIPGKLGCNVTKREGGGLALIKIFFLSLPCDAS